MTKKPVGVASALVTAGAVSLLVGGVTFGAMTALDWAILSQIGVGTSALKIAALIALLPALAASIAIARMAYQVERTGETDG